MRDRTKGDRDWWSAPENELDRHARFIDKEPPTWNCQVQWPATGGFEITVSPLMSRYFDVSSTDDYLDRLITTLVPPRPASVQNYPHGLALPEAIDFLNATWRIHAGSPLIRVRRAEAVARLPYSCENSEQFDAQLSGLCLLLDPLQLPDGSSVKLFEFDSYLKERLPEGNYEAVHAAIGTLRDLFTIRAWRQHSADDRDWRGAANRLGVTLPTVDWQREWAQVQAETITALARIREETEVLETS
jgi:hypothetical protein